MGAPAKHLFGLNRAGQSLTLAKPHPGLPAPRSNAVGRSRNTLQYTHGLSIQLEDGYHFHRSLPIRCVAPVFCGLACGADAPNSFYCHLSCYVLWQLRDCLQVLRWLNSSLASAEDRATQGCDPSADWRLIYGEGRTKPFWVCPLPLFGGIPLPASALKR